VKTPPYLGRWVRPTKPSLVYLASPYSHPDPAVREERFQAACRAAAHLMQSGLHVFSPIAHSHPIALAGSLPTGWEYWEAYDEAVLSACRALAVLELDGWESSRGVQGEVKIAQRLKLPAYYTSPHLENLNLLVKVVKRDFAETAPRGAATRPPGERRTSPGKPGRAA
jgi:hypothetical protein